MKKDGRFLFFIENLTFFSWFYVFPFLLFYRFKNIRSKGIVYYIDKTNPGFLAARFKLWILGFDLRELKFRQFDIRDEKGDSLWLKINHMDLPAFEERILKSRAFLKLFSRLGDIPILKAFLIKQIAGGSCTRLSLGKTFFLISIVKWQLKNEREVFAEPLLFLSRRLWSSHVAEYAKAHGIRTIFVSDGKIDFKEIFVGFWGPQKVKFLRNFFYGLIKGRKFSSQKKSIASSRVGVEYYGQLHLDDPRLHSDLFFYPSSGLSGKDVVVVFSVPQDPLDEAKLSELKQHDIDAAVLNPRATAVSSVPTWRSSRRVSTWERKIVLEGMDDFPEFCWLKREVRNYFEERYDWQKFFEAENIKIYTTWFKYTSSHCAIADAMRRAGGVMTIYQRAFEEFPSSDIITTADVLFAFSKATKTLEEVNRSVIPCHIVVGYLMDYRFILLQQSAQEIRRILMRNGAKRILAYFDENSLDDARWHFGHEVTRENYAFLLQKVLKEPSFGLVLKPKSFRTLPRRLGEVAKLLDEAEKTGRCFTFKEGTIQVSYPPAIAALAADIAVHGHLYAATAGMEAALAGVPTLLVDREGWSVSKFYRLGKGHVIFADWDMLWQACEDYWKNPGSCFGFGDWSSILDELDPFRDGKAAERMGNYLKWLLDGLEEGLRREKVLADCAERYAERWGQDKVFYGIGLDK